MEAYNIRLYDLSARLVLKKSTCSTQNSVMYLYPMVTLLLTSMVPQRTQAMLTGRKMYAHRLSGKLIYGNKNIQHKLPQLAQMMEVKVHTVYTASPEPRPETSRNRRGTTELKLL